MSVTAPKASAVATLFPGLFRARHGDGHRLNRRTLPRHGTDRAGFIVVQCGGLHRFVGFNDRALRQISTLH